VGYSHSGSGPQAEDSSKVKGVTYVFIERDHFEIQRGVWLADQFQIGLPQTEKIEMINEESADKQDGPASDKKDIDKVKKD
jgi:hypothetical protein